MQGSHGAALWERRRAAAAAAGQALARHRSAPEGLWAHLAAHAAGAAGPERPPAAAAACGAVRVLRAAAAHAERLESPAGYLDRPTGARRVPYLLSALEAAAAAAGAPAALALLHVDVLMRSLFIDGRGEELLGMLLEHLQLPGQAGEPASLRTIFLTLDSSTAFWALSKPLAQKVVALPSASGADELAVGVVAPEGAQEDSTPPSAAPAACRRERARFEWQMDQVLGHPAVLELRRLHAEAPTAFAVVLWESIRHACRRPHLAAPACAEELRHPIVQAMLHANLLEPRWGPTRLVVPGEVTRRRLLAWIDEKHAMLPWRERLEYNLQIVRDRHSITQRLDRMAW